MHYRGKIHRHTAKNDKLIRELLLNPLFKVTQEGEVFTRINTNGIGVMENNEWRRCDVANGDGYRVVNLSIQSKGRRQKKRLRVHRIVYQAFVGELDHKMVINHKDGNKMNNKPDNLEQIEGAENTRHALDELGHDPIRNTVINFNIAEEIRALSAAGTPYSVLSTKYGISKGHISDIVNRKIWNRRAKYETEASTPVPF